MRRILITGSTDGIGEATARELARRGEAVIVHGRSRERAEAARQRVARESGSGEVSAVAADLASLQQVRALAREVRERFEGLDVLVTNAGVALKRRQRSADGYELTLAVNHLAHFLLTNLLLDGLQRRPGARVVVVSSMTHSSGRIDFRDLQLERGWDGYQAYANSKLANLLFAYALARRLQPRRVTVNALHPGVIGTKLLRVYFSGGSPPEEGARTPVFLAVSPEVEGVTGRYFVDRREQASSVGSRDRDLQERLWQVSAELTGL